MSTTLSFATTPEVAAEVRDAASQRGVAVSNVLDEWVRDGSRRSRTSHVPETAAEAPESVVKLLESYDPAELRWQVADHRHLMVVAILTRGNEDAKDWLWSVLPREEVRELVRQYAGAGCAEPDRAQLREQLGLTTADIPRALQTRAI